MKFRWLVVPMIVIVVAAMISFALTGQQRNPVLAQHGADSNCDTAGGPAVVGVVPKTGARRGAVVVLPVSAYGRMYLNEIRRAAGMTPSGDNVGDVSQAGNFIGSMRYARIDKTGRFACHALPPGDYYAVAWVPNGDAVGVEVAQFKLASTDNPETLEANRFRPLQELR